MPFAPGRSGNPGGRPRGARNKATIAREALDGEGGEVVAGKLRELAGRGHVFAAHALFDRARRPGRKRAAPARSETAADTGAAAALVLEALAAGSLTTTSAAQLLGLGARPLQTVAEYNGERTEPPCAAGGKNRGERADRL